MNIYDLSDGLVKCVDVVPIPKYIKKGVDLISVNIAPEGRYRNILRSITGRRRRDFYI